MIAQINKLQHEIANCVPVGSCRHFCLLLNLIWLFVLQKAMRKPGVELAPRALEALFVAPTLHVLVVVATRKVAHRTSKKAMIQEVLIARRLD